nr:hypothetical protein [Fodinicola feengrottensis]
MQFIEVAALVVIAAVALLAAIYTRRHLLRRSGGTVEMSVRLTTTRPRVGLGVRRRTVLRRRAAVVPDLQPVAAAQAAVSAAQHGNSAPPVTVRPGNAGSAARRDRAGLFRSWFPDRGGARGWCVDRVSFVA